MEKNVSKKAKPKPQTASPNENGKADPLIPLVQWHPAMWYCPNCANIICKQTNSKGVVKTACPKCQVIQRYEKIGRNHRRIDVYHPTDN